MFRLAGAGATSVVISMIDNGSDPLTDDWATDVAVIVGCDPAVAGATYVAVAGDVAGVTGVSVPAPVRLQVTAEFVLFDTVAVSVKVWVG